MRRVIAMLLAVCSLLASGEGRAEDPAAEVRLPLARYDELTRPLRPEREGATAPARYALGKARVEVSVTEPPHAEVSCLIEVRVPQDGWVAIPVLPAGTAVAEASEGDEAIALAPLPSGLCLLTDKAGTREIKLAYRVDALRSDAGWALPLPLPQASAITVTAVLPGESLDASVIPGAGVRTESSGGRTTVTATVPASTGVQVAWRAPDRLPPAISRASYKGEVKGDAAIFRAAFDVDLFGSAEATVPLLPASVTLRDLKVDGQDAAIVVEKERHATFVRGKGRHAIAAELEVPVVRGDGPPHVEIDVLPVPVSRFELAVQGKKELSVSPGSDVASRFENGTTIATAYVPMGCHVSFRFSESVPEAAKAEAQCNATLTHVALAEEGLLAVHAFAEYEITRGEASVLSLEVPAGVQVDKVASPSGTIVDWRLVESGAGKPGRIDIYLDRQVHGPIACEIQYDRPIAPLLPLPLLRALDVQRQRGMVALAASRDLALEPKDVGGATRVGENQVPAIAKGDVPITHAFKYQDPPPVITVAAAKPDRAQGRFDAEVDTLLSVGEVTLKGSAVVELDVKSGSIDALSLALPAGVNLLSLTGPSIRGETIAEAAGEQRIAVPFTQEMAGRFRLELTYERILTGDRASVPRLRVEGADVEQGRLAVEALSAAEVKAIEPKNLMPLDVGELPQQLVLRTGNPILLAYRYAKADPAPSLALQVTRHHVEAVQEAAIEEASYKTLFTRDGLSVTTVDFLVKNSREQFLRIQLPEGSRIWSAFVDGRPEKPARERPDGGEFLIKVVSSTRGFPVRLIYAVSRAAIGGLGRLRSELPRPAFLVTHTRWELYLPDGIRYGEPSTNMDVVKKMPRQGLHELPRELRQELRAGPVEPLRISVPASGKRIVLEKLYANQDKRPAFVVVPYASGAGAFLGRLVSVAGAFCLSAGLVLSFILPRGRALALGSALAGITILVAGAALYQLSLWPPLCIAIGLGVAAVAAREVKRRRRRPAVEGGAQ